MFFSESDLKKIQDWLKLHSIKDTEFKAASVPLNGLEKLAIVQNGENRTISLYNIMSKVEGGLQYEVIPLKSYLNLAEKNPTTLYFCLSDEESEESEISKLFLGNNPVSPTTDAQDVVVVNKTLYDVLGVKDSSTSTTNAVTPVVSVYNSKSNIYQSGTREESVEFGSMVVNKANTLKASFTPGSSGGIKGNPVFRITQEEDSEIVEINTVTPSSIGFVHESFNPENNYYVGVTSKVKIEFISENGNPYITTEIGENTVERTSYLNVIAQNLLTANNSPYIISGPEVVRSTEDYPSKSISTSITYTPFKYMYIHRSTRPYTINSFGNTLGKSGYLARRTSSSNIWTINTTSPTNQYYAVLLPSEIALSSLYTTFLGNDSQVGFTELGTVTMEGANNHVTSEYKVYSSPLPVAFGDGTMTFKFK